MSAIKLSSTELLRYQRQINLDTFGIDGQLRLKRARVLIVGLGGLGQPCAQILNAAGVGELGLMDADCVEASNLHRQFLSAPRDIGLAKIEVVKQQLERQNPAVNVKLYPEKLSAKSEVEFFKTYDLIIDGTDNFMARYAACDLALKLKKPLLHAAILKESGMLALFEASGPCYRCLYPEPPPPDLIPSCSEAGVLASTTAFFGALLANNAIAWLLGRPGRLRTHFLQCNSHTLDISWYTKPKEPKCPACEMRDFDQLPYPQTPSQCQIPDQKTLPLQDALALKQNYQWVDIRSKEERQSGYIPHSIHIPFERLKESIEELSSDKPLLLYCQSGIRSAKALQTLAHIRSLYQLEKGYLAWLEHEANE
jgi:adenylyltransferase/sulfurtransferase